MKVFISWSKQPSGKIAEALRKFLKSVFGNKIDVFFSNADIALGQTGYDKIHAALKGSDKGIFCFLRNNVNSVWMAYEAGAMSMHKGCDELCAIDGDQINDCPVLPILFEKIETQAFNEHPISMQRKSFSRETMNILVKDLNTTAKVMDEEALLTYFEPFWIQLEKEVKEALYDHSFGGSCVLNRDTLLRELAKNNFPEPTIGEIAKVETTEFTGGFEKQELYSIILNNVSKRLLLFGRKNSKLFANDNRWFFESLIERFNKTPEFEFKCLFLDPSAENASKAQNHPDFIERLKASIKNAMFILENYKVANPSQYCHAYKDLRLDEIIIADDVVLFSHIRFDDDGIPYGLTNASFNVAELSNGNQIGASYKKRFDDAWHKSAPITNEFVTNM
ncbi:MAG: toll/interleukin-1 receptor domain-containing protein [Oscillospiraceae bacterium]|jgi:hypothetical protein|nr:toll/interleukin-1 receptor domain-containing protein [Oscillospiraceae bacterium]